MSGTAFVLVRSSLYFDGLPESPFDKFLRDDIVKWAEVVKKFDKPPQ